MDNSAAEPTTRLRSTPGPPARRPRRHAVRDIAFISFIESYFFVIVVATPFTSTGYEDKGLVLESIAVANDLGAAALSAAGWGIGVLVTTLLGFFAITVGGNYLYRESEDLNLQMRSLALVAELVASTALFCTILIISFCVSNPDELGQLLFVVPAVLVIIFVAVEVGAYLAPEPERVISNATETREWALEKIERIGPRPPHRLWTTLIFNSLAIAFIATSIAMPENTWTSAGSTYAGLVVATVFVAWICTAARSVGHVTRDRFSVILSWVAIALFYLILTLAVGALATSGQVNGSVILAFIALACMVSTWLPRRFSPSWLYEWSLASGTTADAIRTLRKSDQRALDEIAKAEKAIRRRAELIDRDTPTRTPIH